MSKLATVSVISLTFNREKLRVSKKKEKKRIRTNALHCSETENEETEIVKDFLFLGAMINPNAGCKKSEGY